MTTPESGDRAIKEITGQSEDHDQDGSAADTAGRYWFSSTLSPLLAGTFGPMASAFSICALVKNWREYLPDGSESDAQDLRDPPWLLAINALSIAAALIGNMALLLNMAKRLRFSIAQPITISGFYLASILLIADMAALTSSPDYRIDYAPAIPTENHSLTSAFYYAVFAAALYFIIASLMCLTVYGANRGYYEKSFSLTTSQRTLMLQTMSFFVYLLLGALIWSKIEGWEFLDAVYWANVTLLTIGLGDYYPTTTAGMILFFPYAVGGIVVLGLVVGSIRTLVLERGEEKLSARFTEKRRHTAINHVDVDNNTIRIGWFAKANFRVEPDMLPAQRREQEFRIMRGVQLLAERQRRYMALTLSVTVAFILWFVGAVIFFRAEGAQDLDYLTWLFFAYTSLLTIGYGTPAPMSDAGKAFFVFWSLLAIPSLTILISNMGDTVIKSISELTDFVGAITVLPGEHGFRATVKTMAKQFRPKLLPSSFTGPGLFGDFPPKTNKGSDKDEGDEASSKQARILDRIADRVSSHISPEELERGAFAESEPPLDGLDCDIAFYHYVLSREIRNVMKHLSDSPPKKYSWVEWEYYIRLMGNLSTDVEETERFPGQEIPNVLAPEHLAVHLHSNGETDDRKQTPKSEDSSPSDTEKTHLHGASDGDLQLIHSTHTWSMPWSWLSNDSPLMSSQSEAQWIVQRLSAALERELNRTRRGFKRKPPISYCDLRRYVKRRQERGKSKTTDGEAVKPTVTNGSDQQTEDTEGRFEDKVRRSLERAAMSET